MADVHDPRRTPDSGEVSLVTPQGTPATPTGTEDTRRSVSEARQPAQDLTARGKEMATEYYQEGFEQVQVWQKQLEDQVRSKPLQSLLMAAGVGLLIGLLKRR